MLHEAPLTGGFGGEVAATIGREAFEWLDAPVVRLGALDMPVPFSQALEEIFSPKAKLLPALRDCWPTKTTTDMPAGLRIGIDLGGTKTEGIALDELGREAHWLRVPSPRHDYEATLRTIAELIAALAESTHVSPYAPVGIGTPGAISPATGLIKNATPRGSTDDRCWPISSACSIGPCASRTTLTVSRCPKRLMARAPARRPSLA